jgi:serine/threonine protein kinase
MTDIKPNNILVDHNVTSISNPKLSHLGDSVRVQPTTNHIIGSLVFRAPEVFLGLAWSQSVDVWSFGVTVVDGNISFIGTC